MKSYLDISSKYLSMNHKKNRLTIISVIISVTLITGIFSMVDVFLIFEKIQIMYEYGNYHMAVSNPSEEEMDLIRARIDVKNTGRWMDIGSGSINGIGCKLGAVDASIAENMNIVIKDGSYPDNENEIMLEQWATEDIFVNAGLGDDVQISLPDGTQKTFTISGIYNDLGSQKAGGVPGVLLSVDYITGLSQRKAVFFLVEFKDKVIVNKAVAEIKSALNIDDGRVMLNNHLLAVIGQSDHQAATGLYTIGAILFMIVLVAGVVMIYNTFNISIMERVRQFGLLRCIGASRSQIKKLVKREGLTIAARAIPAGVALGMVMTFACSAVLKYYNSSLFGVIPLFTVSPLGIIMGIVMGFSTVYIATRLPARKASRISPVNAVTGSNEIKISKRRKQGYLTKVIHVDIAMGINNATVKKRTLLLMSLSIAFSIMMFLGFNVFINFLHASLQTTKPYTPDISIVCRDGFDESFIARLKDMNGVKRIYNRMSDYVDATFDASLLTEGYLEKINGEITVLENGLFIPSEKTWLISYDEQQIQWAKSELIEGEISEEKMNRENGVIAVSRHLRKGVASETASLKTGDKVYINTPGGTKEMTVMGVMRVEYLVENSPELTMTTLITTEKLFSEITGTNIYRTVHLQLKNSRDEDTVKSIKAMLGNSMSFQDQRQENSEINQLYLTMALFVYGFVVVIAFISILNIMNTMNTSIASKSAYLGVMRAVGMTGKQMNKMILAESGTYTLVGIVTGCLLGVWLQKFLIQNYMAAMSVPWEFPALQIGLVIIAAAVVTVISVISPIKRIRSVSIVEVVNAL